MIYTGLVIFVLALSGKVFSTGTAQQGSSNSMSWTADTNTTMKPTVQNIKSQLPLKDAGAMNTTSIPTMVPGDMSTGKCMCPAPVTCDAGPSKEPNLPTINVPPPSTHVPAGNTNSTQGHQPGNYPGSGATPPVTNPPTPDTPVTDNNSTSGVAGLPNSVSIAGFIAVAASALVI
ncbi:hypothetical protein BY996DRAFT_6414657 [Phakopsora pachyrhizi]|uniref:Secreted protein n=1 Tax=Phakopsora pachyrhizi TaxID=170000 RepID=A0AAV0B8K4_PHAPC|nr:hypothetical protein BY996DRAFT_6420895 [Phakopsora pachyrhizi]KAI8453443.1 hypothetical protein BY996DRAFT_6414657 [Phakopsora pachyrhizi]CAH7682805.1 hypothetical protein PPACK8108_LOCUS15916 [Phakopsora pachyrhizi]